MNWFTNSAKEPSHEESTAYISLDVHSPYLCAGSLNEKDIYWDGTTLEPSGQKPARARPQYFNDEKTLTLEGRSPGLLDGLSERTSSFQPAFFHQLWMICSVGSNSSASSFGERPFCASLTTWFLNFCGYGGRVLGTVDLCQLGKG